MSDNIYASFGQSIQMLAPWPYGKEGKFGDLHTRASRARTTLELFDSVRRRIGNDERLSQQAKQEDTKAAAVEGVKTLAKVQGYLYRDIQDYLEERSEDARIEPYKTGDVATVMIDLALGQKLLELSGKHTVTSFTLAGDPRLMEAAARLPEQLTGVGKDTLQKAIQEAADRKNPTAAKESRETLEAFETAQRALTVAFVMLTTSGGLSRQDQREAAGEYYGLLSRENPGQPPAIEPATNAQAA